MRVDVKKFLFVGVEELREQFFQKAQQAGIINFINASSTSLSSVPQNVQDILAAIKVLRGLEPTEQEEVEDYSLAPCITKEILELKQLRSRYEEELRTLKLEIARVEPFGDYVPSTLSYIEKEGKRKIQFFCARRGKAQEMNLPDELIYVNSDNDLDYFISVSPEKLHPSKMIEMHISHPVGEVREKYAHTERELRLTEQRLRTFTKYNRFLHHAVIKSLNDYHLTEAKNQVSHVEDGRLFYVEGWVPKDKIGQLYALGSEMDVFIEEIAIGPKDVIPTYLENAGNARVGEDLVNIYDTPSHTDNDPSMWVLVWFAIFFALIIGDGGYGLVFLGSALYIRYKIKKPTKGGKRFIKLFTIISAFCIVWGILMNSYFGIEIPIESPLRKVSLLHWLTVKKTAYHMAKKDDVYEEWVTKYPHLKTITDPEKFIDEAGPIVAGTRSSELLNKFVDNIMLEIALMIGTIHIIISLCRYMNRHWSHLGWIIFIIGGYLYFPYFLHATSIIHFVFGVDKAQGAQQGLYFIFGGIAIAMFFNTLKDKFMGMFETMAVIQIFADIMSYLRLYALGLAGGIVAATINQIAEAVPLFIAIFLIAGAHIINMLMGAVGGVIHGLRLNFLEWYHYSFEGGGKKFVPLKEIEIE